MIFVVHIIITHNIVIIYSIHRLPTTLCDALLLYMYMYNHRTLITLKEGEIE